MFYGNTLRKIDRKGRIQFSRKIIEKLGLNPIIIKWGRYLRIYPREREDYFKPSKITECGVNGYNRILIPREFRSSFEKGVVVIGQRDCLEIRPRHAFFPSKKLKRGELKNLARLGIWEQ